MIHFKAFLCVTSVVLLAACNSKPASEEAGAKAAKPKPAAAAKPAVAVNDSTAKMARAVGNGKPGAAVDIKYDILARPAAGTPVQVDVALIPGPGVDSMEATFTGMDGITLAGSLTASFPEVKSGETYKHTLSLLPDRNGVFYITVAVNTQMAGNTLGRTFSLPFVVGKTPVQEKPAAPAVDATGQAIEPMQAEEKGK
jgi:hypothetical protein